MYNSFFKFQEQPFNLTPDPKFVYLSSAHQETLEHMIYGVEQRKGFILITGSIGTGKTTLTRLLMDHLDGKVQTALIFNTFLNEIELLRTINREFGLPAESSSREVLIESLNRFLINQLDSKGNAVLILDEAQNLSVPVLEQVRMLSNLETDSQKLIQIILVGQPELARTLARPDLAQLSQRITVRCRLRPLDLEDTVRYIHHRLSVAGPQGLSRFDSSSYRLIYKYTQGIPRRINALCDRALLAAFAIGTRRVSPAFIRQAQAELTDDPGTRSRRSRLRRLTARPLIPAALIALAIILAAYFTLTKAGGSFP